MSHITKQKCLRPLCGMWMICLVVIPGMHYTHFFLYSGNSRKALQRIQAQAHALEYYLLSITGMKFWWC